MIESRFLNRRADSAVAVPEVSNLKVVGAPPGANVAAAPAKRMRLVVIGSHGVAGANMARFLKLWAGKRLDVTLIEPDCREDWSSDSIMADGSNNGFAEYFPYDPHTLQERYGVRVVGACVTGIDPYGRAVTLADGSRLSYDRLEVAPGARFDAPRRIAVAA